MSTKTEHFPEHSPLGASSAERWMNCPGSNVLLKSLDLPESDEEDWRADGINAHEVAAFCARKGIDTWEVVGPFKGEKREFEVTQPMADAIQMYLDTLADLRKEHGTHLIKELIEQRISGDFNPKFYGTVDNAIVGGEVLDITDYKHGEGIAVDAERNPQLMYYAVGVLEKFMGPTRVRLRIVQPRAFHPDGPVRVWETTTTELMEWKNNVLIPAMTMAELDTTLQPGDWCRFCPAKIACPLLNALFGAAMTADASALPNFTSGALARNYKLADGVKHYIRAMENEVYRRLNTGEDVSDGTTEGSFKLVPKKSNRVFTVEGAKLALEKFGPDAYSPAELKSPAGIDALPGGKAFTKEYAYSPQTGLTVACVTDKRAGVKVQPPAAQYAHIAPPNQPEG